MLYGGEIIQETGAEYISQHLPYIFQLQYYDISPHQVYYVALLHDYLPATFAGLSFMLSIVPATDSYPIEC